MSKTSTLLATVRRLAKRHRSRPAVLTDPFAMLLVELFYDDKGYGSIKRVWPLIQAVWPAASDRAPHLSEGSVIGRFIWGLKAKPSPGGNALARLAATLQAYHAANQPRPKPEAPS